MTREEQASQIRATAMDQIRQIQGDSNLSREGKGRQIAAIRNDANDKIRKLRAEHERERSENRDAALRKAFGLSFSASVSYGDRALARLSFRDALFRTDGIKTSSEAQAMFERATVTGDKELQRAIGLKAFERNWSNILTAYANSSPDVAGALDQIEATHVNSKATLAASMHFSAIAETPEERSIQPTFHNAA